MTLLCSRGLVGLVIVCVTCRQALGEDEAAPVSLPSAVQRGRELVATAATHWHQNKNCFACHHQTLPVLALVEAGRFGAAVDPEWLRVQTKHTHDYFHERVEGMLAGEHVPGGASSTGFGLWALKLAQHPADDVTAAMVENLLKIQGVVRLSESDSAQPAQLKDGAWLPSCRRPPLQGSDIATTVLALIGMEHYATDEQRERLGTARAVADKWLAETPLVTATDRAWRLWGLSLFGGEVATIEATRAAIFKTQRADGGWSETDDRQSDAYSTGETLFVLLQTGTPATDPAVLRTRDYLIKSQHADGSWLVETHVKPVQTFFENGDPHGKHQFLSTAATAWSTAALTQLLPLKNVTWTPSSE